MIKEDIQKVYDTVDWRFLKQMLEELHFPSKFTRWVVECVSTVNYSIVINGEPTKSFDAARGLRKFGNFTDASGLQANMSKSAIYFGGVFRDSTCYKKAENGRMETINIQDHCIGASWVAKKLSYAGRVQLVKTVLFGVQSYWVEIFIIPAKVMKAIQAYCRNYIWSGANEITRKAFGILEQNVCAKVRWMT
uniref:Uncharacterized protein LOC104232938 n=1 Tax=Nicotiana sylvestris TaxID=4096 RepID=A0A1U7X4A6_NICSY|nr:PREDICTED: uncharacterized protein LOC104232938 [Nicotiana sylvestris]